MPWIQQNKCVIFLVNEHRSIAICALTRNIIFSVYKDHTQRYVLRSYTSKLVYFLNTLHRIF